MKGLKYIAVLWIIILGVSCESSTYEEAAGVEANPTYNSKVKAIIDNNCLSCHSAIGKQFPTLETFAQVKESAQNGELICRIDDQSCGAVMPTSGRMPQVNIDVIKKWAANGYPN